MGILAQQRKFATRKFGFTLAEVLITLGVIGVVAAMTLPILVQNYQKKQYVTQLKKSYTTIQNAFRTAMAEDGVDDLRHTTLWQSWPSGVYDLYPYDIKSVQFERFFNNLKKYLNIVEISDYTYRVKELNGSGGGYLDNYYASLRLSDGSLLTNFRLYKPGESGFSRIKTKTAGGKLTNELGLIVIDVNSDKKGPNQIGRDIFHFSLGPDGMLYPHGGIHFGLFYASDLTKIFWNSSNSDLPCDPELGGSGCAGRIIEEGWQMNY